MQLNEQAILSLCKVHDPMGVLSLYVGTTPDRQSGPQPAWVLSIRNQLSQLRARVKDEGPRERWVAVHSCLDSLAPDLDRLLDPRGHGRGRALFVPVSHGDPVRFDLQVPLDDQVVLEPRPYVRPLVAVLGHGRPSGVTAVDRSGVRLLEWRLGEAEDLVSYEFDEATGDWREMKGPGPSAAGVSQLAPTQRDRFERRLDDNRGRFLKATAEQVAKVADTRGWDRIVVLSVGRFEEFEHVLRNSDREVLHAEHHPGHAGTNDIVATATRLLDESQRRSELELVRRARDRSAAGGAAVAGVAEVLDALGQGRVAHLLLDEGADWEGWRGPDGRLYAGRDGSEDPELGLVGEPHLAERMIERALETSAKVTPVGSDAAAELAPHGGAAALLRW